MFEFAVTSGPLEVANWRYEFEDTEVGLPGHRVVGGQAQAVVRHGRPRHGRPQRRARRAGDGGRRWPTWPSRRRVTTSPAGIGPHARAGRLTSSRRNTCSAAASSPGPPRACSRSTTARRCASSTFPPYLNLASHLRHPDLDPEDAQQLRRVRLRRVGHRHSRAGTSPAGGAGSPRRSPARPLVVHACLAQQLHRAVVRRRDPQRRVLRRRSPSTTDGTNAQSSATLSTTRGFSDSAPNTGLARTRCSHTVVPASTNCVGTTTGNVTVGPARCDQVAEGMRLHEGTPLLLAGRGVDRGDEHQ